jgi:hypothetical protein
MSSAIPEQAKIIKLILVDFKHYYHLYEKVPYYINKDKRFVLYCYKN